MCPWQGINPEEEKCTSNYRWLESQLDLFGKLAKVHTLYMFLLTMSAEYTVLELMCCTCMKYLHVMVSTFSSVSSFQGNNAKAIDAVTKVS